MDNKEMSELLRTIGATRHGDFLCALSDVVIKADDEDYSIIRPALMNLKRKYAAANPQSDKAFDVAHTPEKSGARSAPDHVSSAYEPNEQGPLSWSESVRNAPRTSRRFTTRQ